MRIGLLTAGGDCPGLNAVIRGVVARARQHGADVVGILEGWDGLMEGRFRPLDRDAVRGILQRGGTILGTSRRDPYVHGDGAASVRGAIEGERLDGLIVVGGDGTLRSALALWEEGVPLVGVPKTIDNDIPGTDVTFGFDTADADRNRGDRPDHDDRGVARPRDGRRGDGPNVRLDRGVRRHRGGGRRDPRARGALRPVGAGRAAARPAPRAAAATPWSSSPRASRRRRERRSSAPLDAFGFERLGGVSAVSRPSSSG